MIANEIAPNATALAAARELGARLGELLRREHHAMADFLLALAAFDRRKLWRELGHASLFSFLRRELGLSAGAAQYRKTAAELVQAYPEVEQALRDGRLCLSSVVELAKVLTTENRLDVLPRFFGLSRREAAQVAVEIRPVENAPVRELLVPLPATSASGVERGALRTIAPLNGVAPQHDAPAHGAPTDTSAGSSPVDSAVRPGEPARLTACATAAGTTPARTGPLPVATVDPLDAGHSRLHITVSRRFLAKLASARAELSHALPGASSEQVLEAALDALLAQRARRKGAAIRPRKPSSRGTMPVSVVPGAVGSQPPPVAMKAPDATQAPDATVPPAICGSSGSAQRTPRPAAMKPPPSTIPAAAKRAAWARSRGGCEWPLDAGGVCGSTTRLEVDHVVPRALGGPSSADNLRILCRAHNQLAARRVLGDACVDHAVGRWKRGVDQTVARPRPCGRPAERPELDSMTPVDARTPGPASAPSR